MILLKKKDPVVLIMVIGYKEPEFMLDTGESVQYYNRHSNLPFEVVYAVDYNQETAEYLEKAVGKERVYRSPVKNGWGRGILKTIFDGLDHFEKTFYFSDLVTMDDDCLCVGPFIDQFYQCSKDNPNSLFVGNMRWSIEGDYICHKHLHYSGFLSHMDFKWHGSLIFGPCMWWTGRCVSLLPSIGLRPSWAFQQIYDHVFFPHDQISTFLAGVGLGDMIDVGYGPKMEWRCSLPVHAVPGYGQIPFVEKGVNLIHPINADYVTPVSKIRSYFRDQRLLHRKKIGF